MKISIPLNATSQLSYSPLPADSPSTGEALRPGCGQIAVNPMCSARRPSESDFDVANTTRIDMFVRGTLATTREAEPTLLSPIEGQLSRTRDLNTRRGREQTNTNRSENLGAWRSLSFGERVRHREGGLAQKSRRSVYS